MIPENESKNIASFDFIKTAMCLDQVDLPLTITPLSRNLAIR